MDIEATDSGKHSKRNERGRRSWTLEQRRHYRAWHNYYPTLAYARNDPKTFYVAIDHAARMAGMNQCGFYNRYLLSGELPYVVLSWWHGKGRRRQKSFIPRSALLEVLTKGLCQEARRRYARRSRKRMGNLEQQLNERATRAGR
jgi:hypothetical protein